MFFDTNYTLNTQFRLHQPLKRSHFSKKAAKTSIFCTNCIFEWKTLPKRTNITSRQGNRVARLYALYI